MSRTTARPRKLADVVAAYGPDASRAPHAKVSISLPSELIEQVRAAAAERGLSVSAVIAASLRSAIAAAEQESLDAALEAQNDENVEVAQAYLPTTARLWAEAEW